MEIIQAKMEKGVIYCTTDNGKTIKVDLNAKVIYGVSGKALKVCVPFRNLMSRYEYKTIRNEVRVLQAAGTRYNIDTLAGLTALSYVDRLVNMGIDDTKISQIMGYYNGYYADYTCELNDNKTYRYIAKILKEYPTLSFYDAVEKDKETALYEKYKASFEGLNEQQIKIVKNLVSDNPKCNLKYVPEFCSWVRFDHWNMLGRRISWSYNGRDFWENLDRYLRFCEKHNIEIPKRNIYTHLCTTYIAYLAVKDKEKNDRLAEKYIENSVKFMFEDENFTMVFPKTVQDFVTEGDTLNHCVGWNGYDNSVIKGNCVIAFIRYKNNPSKAFFTCDIRKTSRGEWYINQFLGQNNCGIRDNVALMNYYQELGKFLKKLS